MVAHDLLDSLGGLIGVVEGDERDKVVEHVGLDDSVHEVAADETELAIDGRGSATGIVPGLRVVVRERGIGVLKEGDGDDPVVDTEVGDTVPEHDIGESPLLDSEVEDSTGDGDSNVGVDNEVGLLRLVDGGAGIEVGDTGSETVALAVLATALLLASVEVVASVVAGEVDEPSEQLLDNNGVEEGSDGGLLAKLRDVVTEILSEAAGVLKASGRDPGHVLLDVTGRRVMLVMREFP